MSTIDKEIDEEKGKKRKKKAEVNLYLIPAVLGAPSSNIQIIAGRSTWTIWAIVAWAISTAVGGSGGVQSFAKDSSSHGTHHHDRQDCNQQEIHFFPHRYFIVFFLLYCKKR